MDAGPFGKIAVNGILNGMGSWTGNYVPGDNPTHAALSNGQVLIQKTDGWFQFYVQAGVYNLPSLGVPFLETDKTMSNIFGPVPVAFVKLQAAKNTSILVGALPTLIGAEYTFTFENMNIDRGLLWNQENAVNRGIQVNQTMGKFTASLSWNDGFYSNRYTWLSGSLAYTKGPHTLAFVAGGNYGKTAFQTLRHARAKQQPNLQRHLHLQQGGMDRPTLLAIHRCADQPEVGVVKGASTNGVAILVNHTFKHGFSLPVRLEYITSSGNVAQEAVNLMYGPGSGGTSITVTPTFQNGGFFFRGDLAYAHISDITPGYGFGQGGNLKSQPRALAEFGFIFGNNVIEKKAP